jgi:hypothetical protein
MPVDPLQAAVDQANNAIRAYLRTLPEHPHLWTPAQHERYGELLAAWGQAVRAARETEPEPEPAAA